ncbi:metal-dependent hydrolase [Nocardioides sp. B-3]|uniref:metal-dependent hydrolase n=1 Tax=Nocardioides sp. B-3 TaxID=2895565 RepID=UPI00215232DD|nr:metal-dependent hydrolase [Nocardioides sp. B-3]
MHARAHDEVLGDLFRARGYDTAAMVAVAERVFREMLGPRNLPTAAARHKHLVARLALIGGIETFTALLGDWVLSTPLEKFEADPVVLDLFRWHGAEEVEHRMVAHDVAEYFGVSYPQRAASVVVAYVGVLLLIARAGHDPVRRDPDLPDHSYARIWFEFLRSGHRGTLPSVRRIGWSALPGLHPRFTPEWLGSTAQAVAYPAKSPAARAAG